MNKHTVRYYALSRAVREEENRYTSMIMMQPFNSVRTCREVKAQWEVIKFLKNELHLTARKRG